MCKLRPLERRFTPEFRGWVANLTRLYLWRRAGYPLASDALSFESWQAMSVIARYYEVKDLEAVLKAGGAACPFMRA